MTKWHVRDRIGLVHLLMPPNRNGDILPVPRCHMYQVVESMNFETTLAEVTCLWCIAERQL